MKRGRSTGKPTVEEAARIVAVKSCECVACGFPPPCDAHHLLSGGRRRGHMFTIGLCVYCHRGHPWAGRTGRWMRANHGPSLMDGSKLFHATYGDDETLLQKQERLLEAM